MVRTADSICGDIVYLDEPDIVRAIRARAPAAQIVLLPSAAPPHARAEAWTPGASGSRVDAVPAILTRREQDILMHVATGETNAEIGDAMGLARNTVKAYLQTLMRKLGARNRVEALTYARTFGLI